MPIDYGSIYPEGAGVGSALGNVASGLEKAFLMRAQMQRQDPLLQAQIEYLKRRSPLEETTPVLKNKDSQEIINYPVEKLSDGIDKGIIELTPEGKYAFKFPSLEDIQKRAIAKTSGRTQPKPEKEKNISGLITRTKGLVGQAPEKGYTRDMIESTLGKEFAGYNFDDPRVQEAMAQAPTSFKEEDVPGSGFLGIGTKKRKVPVYSNSKSGFSGKTSTGVGYTIGK